MILVLCPNPSVDTRIHLEHLEPGTIHTARLSTPFPGGKGVHVALAARELGDHVELVGFWAGPSGAWIRSECEKRGVPTHGPKLAGWTRRCLTYLEEGGRETEIREPGAQLGPDSMEAWADTLRPLIQRASRVCVSGSWPLGTPDQPYLWLADRCREANVPLWVDASGPWLKRAVEVRPHGIHLNRSEAEGLIGPISSTGEAARKLLHSCTVAAVTDGAEGLWLATKTETIHASCRVHKVISTVGCGDCLTGGLLVAEERETTLLETAQLAAAAGSANCLTPDLGMIKQSDVDRLLPTVSLTTSNFEQP